MNLLLELDINAVKVQQVILAVKNIQTPHYKEYSYTRLKQDSHRHYKKIQSTIHYSQLYQMELYKYFITRYTITSNNSIGVLAKRRRRAEIFGRSKSICICI